MTEKAWQRQVEHLATLYQWSYYHAWNSQHSVPGWPDLVLVRPPEILYAELKTDKGKTTRAQDEWLQRLRDCGQEVHVWRPADFEEMHERLKLRASAR